jgi:hypothetical protein
MQCAPSVEVARQLVLGAALLLAAAVSPATSGCSSTSSASAGDGGLSCGLGGECSQTQIPVPDAGGDGNVADAASSNECTAAGGRCLGVIEVCAVLGTQSCDPGSAALGVHCCLSETADCGQPGTTTYACPAFSDGGAVCKGSAPVPFGAPGYDAPVEAGDPDAVYPVGCTATFPACNIGQAPTCTCVGPTWSCLN